VAKGAPAKGKATKKATAANKTPAYTRQHLDRRPNRRPGGFSITSRIALLVSATGVMNVIVTVSRAERGT
jgi:hypothetical protein